jgi:hypothetical protein
LRGVGAAPATPLVMTAIAVVATNAALSKRVIFDIGFIPRCGSPAPAIQSKEHRKGAIGMLQ